MKTVLTIAGSDSIGGAGIQADIKAISANGCYAMSVITSVTAQNTMGVYGIHDIPPEFVKKQLEAVFSDIVPDAVKIGMLSNSQIIDSIADFLKKNNVKNIVTDTVMVSTSGHRLITENAITALSEKLIPISDIITPNIPEAEVLSEMNIKTTDDMKMAAEKIMQFGCRSVIVKGGHLNNSAADVFFDGNSFTVLENPRIDNPNTHGTGCTLSSSLAAFLAQGYSMKKGVELAKGYVTGAIADCLDLGKGRGPLNHFYKKAGKANEL